MYSSHIYIPLGGSHKGPWRQLFASAVCFAFIYLWHGGTNYLMSWAFLNYIGIVAEVVGTKFTRLEAVRNFEVRAIAYL